MTGANFGLTGVSVAFGDVVALGGVDVEVTPGRVTALIGADGAGKTTACRVMVGLVGPDQGSVRRPAMAPGYQPESAGTWSDLTVTENLDFVARVFGVDDDGRKTELLRSTALTAAADRLSADLSGGMRQKLAVAMAILPRPELVVLDEPTTGLDPVSRADLWRLLAQAASDGAAILVTTSYLDEAERAGHVVVLDGGTMAATGTAASIRASFPGTITVSEVRPDSGRAWRRGRTWRRWNQKGDPGPGGSEVAPDLVDVVTAAALSREERS